MTAGEAMIAQGEQRGELRLLFKMLANRFGTLPERIVARLNAADTREIEVLADRLLAGATQDELFPG